MDSDEYMYRQICADRDAELRKRRDNPKKYPYLAYFPSDYRNMTYLTKEEAKSAVKDYHLYSNGKGGYERYGREPIFILPREETEDGERSEG